MKKSNRPQRLYLPKVLKSLEGQEGLNFMLYLTSYTAMVEMGGYKYIYSGKVYTAKELAFITKVKSYAETVAENFPEINKSAIRYYEKGRNMLVEGDVLTNIYEIDLNSAYWKQARKSNAISDEIYEQGKFIDKYLRLAALGALATRKYVFRFEDGKYSQLDPIINYKTRNVWFDIVFSVSWMMQEAMKEAGLFFWVDAVFCEAKDLEKIGNVFKKYGFEFKIKKIKKLEVLKTGPEKILIWEENKPEPRLFTIPENQVGKLTEEFKQKYSRK